MTPGKYLTPNTCDFSFHSRPYCSPHLMSGPSSKLEVSRGHVDGPAELVSLRLVVDLLNGHVKLPAPGSHNKITSAMKLLSHIAYVPSGRVSASTKAAPWIDPCFP